MKPAFFVVYCTSLIALAAPSPAHPRQSGKKEIEINLRKCKEVVYKTQIATTSLVEFTSPTCRPGTPLALVGSGRSASWIGSFLRPARARHLICKHYRDSCSKEHSGTDCADSPETHLMSWEFSLKNPVLPPNHASFEELPMTSEEAADALAEAKRRCETGEID